MDYIVTLYGCMFLVGVLANGTLGLALCTGPGAKSRSPLLLGLVAADFCVCCLSGPITAALYTITSWSQSWSDVALFLQAWPISSCTLSMMSLSIDRYLTVKNYRPAGQVVRRRPLLLTVVLVTWLAAALFSSLQFAERNPWRRSFLIVRVMFIHVVPACTVLACHLGVHAKLTALSLTARAKHGELPLPMPLLRRPTHVIIVAGISNRLETEEVYDDSEDVTELPPSVLRSARLANAMLLVSVIFAVCWLPHVICLIVEEAYAPPPLMVQRYSLFLGQFHSAMSPIMYWILNYQWLRRSYSLKVPTLYRRAPTTNEALELFNSPSIRLPPVRRRSSYCLYRL